MSGVFERLQAALADRYAVESEIGRGGMATVFLAEDLKHRRKVAIKVLHPELSVTLAAERFLNEIQIAAGLNHPHILTLHESGEADGLLYYVMPYVPGESLRHRLEREGQLPVEEAVRIAVEVADGLEYAHEHGVIHRDVKPGNILLSSKHAVITDFGIARAITVAQGARVTSTGLGVGTPLYASPEQATGAETLDGRTDVYSLGCVLYEMLSGEVPLAASTPNAVQARRLTETPGPIHALRDTVPPLLDQVIAKALARLPADRWDSAEKFGQALMTATMDATPVARLDLATTPGLEAIAAGRPEKWRPSRWVAAAGVMVVAALGAWIVIPRVASLTGSGDRAAPGEGAAPIETRIPLEGRFGELLGWGTSGSFAISPDGRQLAYCSRDEDGVDRLRLADLSAPERPHGILASGTRCTWVRWTPSGERVLFEGTIAGRTEYYEASPLGGSPRPFLDCPQEGQELSPGVPAIDRRWAVLSPDESFVAYNALGLSPGYFRVALAADCDFGAGDSIPVGGDVPPIMTPRAWSPRGDRVLLEAQTEGGVQSLWTIGTDGEDLHQINDAGEYYPVWWPQPGGAIYWQAGRRVMRQRVSRSGEPRGAPEPVDQFEANPIDWFSITSDGQSAIVARKFQQYRIVRVAAVDGNISITPVTDKIPGYGAFGLSHDGQWVAFAQQTAAGGDLFKVSIAGGTPTRLTSSGEVNAAEWPAWSPDDQYLAFSGRWRDTLRVWLVTADGSRTGTIMDVMPNYEMPALSWDGPDLLYMRHDYQLEALRAIQLESGQWQGNVWRPAPDRAGATRNFVARAERQLLGDTARWAISGRPRGSREGDRAVAFVASREAGSYWHLVSDLGGEPSFTPLVESSGGQPLAWTRDGRSLYWQSGNDIQLWNVDGDRKETLLTLSAGTSWMKAAWGSGSDCQPRHDTVPLEFVCAIDDSYAELFLVDDFDPQMN